MKTNKVMIQVLSDTKPIAKKRHRDDAAERVMSFVNNGIYTFAEYRMIVEAKRKGFFILPGERYLRQVNIYDGDFCTFKASEVMHKICLKYNLYE